MTKAELEKKLYARKQELGDQVRWGKITPDFALEMMIFETLAYSRNVIATMPNKRWGAEWDIALRLAKAELTVTI